MTIQQTPTAGMLLLCLCDHDVTTRHRQRTAASEIAYERDDILLWLLTDQHRPGKLRTACITYNV